MIISIVAVCIGIVAGLRTMTAPAAVSWAAYLGWIDLAGSPVAFFEHRWTPWILLALAIGELIVDQLPSTPSRKVPFAFGARLLSGALSGAALAASGGSWIIGALLGATGAVIGTLGGHAARAAMAAKFRRDPPAAIIEDVVAIVAAVLLVRAFA